jgi:S-adenosylmethionine:diacylglycerol 3-amino-3-carboxypropyl transferase
MTAPAKAWGLEQRFFLPNEDARPVAAALALLPAPVRRPVFVGGSGLLLLEVVSRAGGDPRATFVDLAPFQVEYFREVVAAVRAARSAADLRWWFAEHAHPRLQEHYRARGAEYPLQQVLRAMEERFALSLFFEDGRLARAREVALATAVRCADVVEYLEAGEVAHDFVYLSNVLDYLGPERAARLFAAARRGAAAVYALVTSACPAPEAVLAAAAAAGYARHPGSGGLDALNHGLGSGHPGHAWNRPGTIHLFTPASPGSEAP